MKILVALHSVMDLGGIINHTEQLIGGLKDLSHTVHLKEIVYSLYAHDKKKTGDWIIGPSGIPHDQGKGWNFQRKDRIPYKSQAQLASARQILNGYDMVIWTVPVPSKNRLNAGNHEWISLYDLDPGVMQVAFIHDGNSYKGYPYMTRIQEHLNGVACVHPCALESSSFLDVPRALVVNPQYDPLKENVGWGDKLPGFVNMQTFKAWKHAHELIQAIAYMPRRGEHELREVAGKGIEYQYMTSEEKCKEQYFHMDNDYPFVHKKFWDAAIENGMIHHGYWNQVEVAKWLNAARVLVDPSWSRNYSKFGGHFNRVMVEAMIHGAVPVARRLGAGTEIFQPGVHYVEIPEGASPQQYADIVLETGNMDQFKASAFREANLEVLPMFDRKTVAQRLIDLAFGELDDIRTDVTINVSKKAEDVLFNHFGVL